MGGTLTGTLPVESDLAASLGVGRGALREAVKALTAKGMLAVGPRVGTRVRPPEEWNRLDPEVIGWWWAQEPEAVVGHVQELRRLLEPAAAELAAKRASDADREELVAAASRMQAAGALQADLEFHVVLLRAAGNPLMATIGTALSAVYHPVFECTSSAGRTAEAADLHATLAQAVARGDSAGARTEADHLLNAAAADYDTAKELGA